MAAAAQAQPGSASSIGAAPTVGSRLPAILAAADELLLLPRVLLQQVPASAFGESSSSTGGRSSMCSGEQLQQLAAAAHNRLVSSGLDPEDLSHFSSAEAEEGAAVAVCAEALDRHTPPQKQAAALQNALPLAAGQLLDLGAQHKSVALSLLPLGALCTACSVVARSASAAGADGPGSSSSGGSSGGSDCRLAASTPTLSALLSALVAIMAHNPVQLVRSCSHDALQALLDAFAPSARLEQLRALLQVGLLGGSSAQLEGGIVSCLHWVHSTCSLQWRSSLGRRGMRKGMACPDAGALRLSAPPLFASSLCLLSLLLSQVAPPCPALP